MNFRKFLKFTFLFLVIYFALGALLLRFEYIQNLYFFPGFKIQFGQEPDEDLSRFSSDGPLVVVKNDSTVQYRIIPHDTSFIIKTGRIHRKDALQCYVDETRQKFVFHLKDSLRIEKDEYTLPDKMLITSDIEGNFKGLESILKGTGVIDNNFSWKFGNGHLVLNGDLFDRGLNVTECLWLIYKLEEEAEKAGGKVHFILGNHEMMNMRGHLKYLRDKYYENADALGIPYEKWYSPDTELGRWLRTKNAVEKIGPWLFTHAGISKDFPSDTHSLKEINNTIRSRIDKAFDKKAEGKDMFIGSQSPLWYRGIAGEDEDQKDVEKTLANFRAAKMIVGHTIQDKISYLYDKKVIAIDLEHKANSDKGLMQALWFGSNDFYVIDNRGVKVLLK